VKPGPARHQWTTPFLLLLPIAAVLLACFITPVAILARYSFYIARPGGEMIPAWVLDNYTRFLVDTFHLGVLWNTVRLGLWVAAVCLVLGFPLAYSLARTPSRRRRSLGITVLLIPLMTSVVVRSYGWMILLASSGPINTLLLALGLIDRPLQLLFKPQGVVIALAEVLLPFMVLSIMPVIQGIDPHLEEASQSLGAGPISTFRRVVLPLSLPGIAAGSILVFVLTISAFATPRLVGGATTQVMSIFIYDQALSVFNWPFGAAVSILLLAVVLFLTWLQGRAIEGRGVGGAA
jgi:putative spermidine/putrescine transport system permease protein